MANYELFIQLNAFKNIMVRLGDGLRIAREFDTFVGLKLM